MSPSRWRRMPIEAESPEEFGYEKIRANLAESSCRDRRLSDLGVSVDDLLLLYGDHRGDPELRRLLASDVGLGPEAVVCTAGAAMGLFLVAQGLLDRGDHLVVVRPNYGTNLETPRALGCDVDILDLRFEEGWQVDPDRVAGMLRPTTRLVSVTNPHNPTGVELSDATLDALIALAERHGFHLLVDETYGEMGSGARAAGRSPRVISVASVSKTYGLPGIRQGWVITGDPALQERLLAVKEQVVLTGSVLDEAIALQVLRRRGTLLPAIRAHIASQRAVVERWIAGEDRLEWVAPTGGVVGFPRIRGEIDLPRFYAALREDGVFVGPGHWFEQSDRYFRIGWGWPAAEELEIGLRGITAALDRAC